MAPPFDMMMAPDMLGMDPMAYFAMSRMTPNLPRIDPTRYAEGYEIRKSLRGAFTGPGTHPVGARMGHGGQLSQMLSGFGGGPYPAVEQDFNPEAANVLGQYGLSPARPNPFLFFNDMDSNGEPTWAARHEKTARAIEGAMLGAANTQQGMTVGENISNVARSVMSIPGMYRQSYNAQMQAPFDQAKQIAAMQDDQINMQAKLAQAYHLYATGKQALERPPKVYGTNVYADSNGHYVMDEAQGTKKYIDNEVDFKGGPTTKVGTPHYGKASGNYPAGVKSQSERMGYDAYLAANGELNPDGTPKDVKRYQNFVYASQGRSAAETGGGRTTATETAKQNQGGVSQADQDRLKALETDMKQKQARAKERLRPSQFVDAQDPLAAMKAEQEKRQSEADSAAKAYSDATEQVRSKQPRSKLTGGASRPKTLIHPNGTIEIQ